MMVEEKLTPPHIALLTLNVEYCDRFVLLSDVLPFSKYSFRDWCCQRRIHTRFHKYMLGRISREEILRDVKQDRVECVERLRKQI